MSNFKCKKCGAYCQDTPRGYVTGCEHYPADTNRVYAKGVTDGISPSVSREKENARLRSEVSRLKSVAELARDAVEAGAIDECYLSLLRDAINALPKDKNKQRIS